MIYLDSNARAPLDPRVVAEMVAIWEKGPLANPSSVHSSGQRAKALWNQALSILAKTLHVDTHELVITSGATESAYLCVDGFARNKKQGHIITSDLEHPSLLGVIDGLASKGFTVTKLQPGLKGVVTADLLKAAIRSDTILVAISAANSETGLVADVQAIADFLESLGIAFFLDGVAWLGKESMQIPKGVSFFTASAHKLHGPEGVGLAVVKRKWPIDPLFVGGGQQNKIRAGTQNVIGAYGMACAFAIQAEKFSDHVSHMLSLRESFESKLKQSLDNIVINGDESHRVCNTSNIYFKDIDGEELLIALDQAGIAASLGSACSSNNLSPSKVLMAMGYPHERALSSLRFSFSRMNTMAEVDEAVAKIIQAVKKSRR